MFVFHLGSLLGRVYLVETRIEEPVDVSNEPASKAENKFPFNDLLKFHFWFWCGTSFCATLCHIKKNGLTSSIEALAFFISTCYSSYVGLLRYVVAVSNSSKRLLWVVRLQTRLMIALPLMLFMCLHMYSLSVDFDYDYNTTVCALILILHSLGWLAWCHTSRHRYVWKNLAAQMTMWGLSIFELWDFPQIMQVSSFKSICLTSFKAEKLITSHSLRHLCFIVITIMWTQFLIADAQNFLKKEDRSFLQILIDAQGGLFLKGLISIFTIDFGQIRTNRVRKW